MNLITTVNDFLNGVVWGPVGIALLAVTGLLMSIKTGFFQIRFFKHWHQKTIGAIFKNKEITAHTSDKTISQFQSLCTALAATIGTGNIVGVSTAIISGGPGAVFWMWIMALVGMMTNYSENVLGIFYRVKNEVGEWNGGAMYYLENGLGAKKNCKKLGRFLGVLFCLFCVLASFGIGNIAQVNSIAGNMKNAFNIPNFATGIFLVFLIGIVVVGGLKRVAAVTEKLVPFMAITYIIGAIIVVCMHGNLIGAAIVSIFKGAFGVKSVTGGIVGYGLKQAITLGCKRGAFSNEAGLGSSVMVHSSSNVKEPVEQGMWGIFEVFADTIIVCTLTALVILTSGYVDLTTGIVAEGINATSFVATIFGDAFGPVGTKVMAIAILLFAYSTVLGWSHYGSKSMEYLFGLKITRIYKVIFVLMTIVSATMDLKLAWDLSDTFNGLMMIPNLIGVVSLSPVVVEITKNYISREIKHEDTAPICSAYELSEE